MRKESLALKVTVLCLVAATGLVCGWSSLGLGSGVGLAIALTAGAAVAVFRGENLCSGRQASKRESG